MPTQELIWRGIVDGAVLLSRIGLCGPKRWGVGEGMGDRKFFRPPDVNQLR